MTGLVIRALNAGETELFVSLPDPGLPPRPDRLVYRPEPDDDVVLEAFRRVHHGSLDAHSRRVTTRSGVDAAAREDAVAFAKAGYPIIRHRIDMV